MGSAGESLDVIGLGPMVHIVWTWVSWAVTR
jgi:hypothetical protein